jgi:hypothetical protein
MAQAGVCLLTPGWLASCCAGREWEAMSARRMGTFGEHLSFSHTYGLRDPVTPEDLEKVEALATEVAHAIYAGRKPVCSWPMVPGQPP